MQISPYLSFNGNCAEAVALYEKAFKTKAKVIRYKDAPAEVSDLAPADFVYHAQIRVFDDTIILQDVLPKYSTYAGDNVMITLCVDEYDKNVAQEVFHVLKEGNEAAEESMRGSWIKCIGLLTDRFGIRWNICAC
ncbi:MAG: VOC family protein [Lachnospiraceae bacterium]|nr:VOC family protein [Lachnospiraceae bacterium]